MEKGDIDNGMGSRILVVAQPLILTMTPRDMRKAEFYRLTGQWKRWVQCWSWDSWSVIKMRDMCWRLSLNVTLAAFVPHQRCEKHLRDAADARHIGCKVETYESPAHLARQIAFMPEVIYIVSNDPVNRYIYGSRTIRSLADV